MKRLITPSWWVKNWPITLVYLLVCGVFVFTVGRFNSVNETTARDSRARAADLRDANVRFCQSSNERTAVIRDFVLAVSQDPDPRQFDFITDPVLRAGALDQARRTRAEMRARVSATFTLRDCDAEFPPVPPIDH